MQIFLTPTQQANARALKAASLTASNLVQIYVQGIVDGHEAAQTHTWELTDGGALVGTPIPAVPDAPLSLEAPE